MNILKRFIPAVLPFFLYGCGSVSENVKDVDFEKEEYDQAMKIKEMQGDPIASPSTPDRVEVADKDDVTVTMIKSQPVKGPYDVDLQTWNVSVNNDNRSPRCVAIAWKLMDFQFESYYPTVFYMPPKTTRTIGVMKQTLYDFGGIGIPLPPSGYVEGMRVRKTETVVEQKYEEDACIDVVDDEDVTEKARNY